ncbi:hypothetical protein [Borreliella valaisiana]|nr:hypothetical protein KJD09_05035 [Borreliella valaisiana]
MSKKRIFKLSHCFVANYKNLIIGNLSIEGMQKEFKAKNLVFDTSKP